MKYFFRKFDKLDFIELCACLNKNFYKVSGKIEIKFNNKIIEGFFKQINEKGELVIKTLENKNLNIPFGEII